jgi:hypothetical protein
MLLKAKPERTEGAETPWRLEKLTALSGSTPTAFYSPLIFQKGGFTHMARNKPLTIGGKHFATRKDAIFVIQQLLNREPLFATVGEPFHTFLCDLVARHPRAAEKIGKGISHFTIGTGLYGTLCLYLHRVDGTRTDFSYLKCVRGAE